MRRQPRGARFVQDAVGALGVISILALPAQSCDAQQVDQVPAQAMQPAAPPAQQTGAPAEPSDMLSSLDGPRNYLSEQVVSYATAIDRYFGGDRNFQETNKSVIQVDITRSMGQLGDNKYIPSGRAKVDLPNTEKRLHLLFETDPDKNISGVTPQGEAAPATPTTGPDSYAAALRYEKSREEEARPKYISTDAGVRMSGLSLRPFARARGSYSVPMDQWRIKAAETFFWFNTIGPGETTQVDVEHLISDPVLFRATSSATWLSRTQNFDFRQDFSVFHTVDERNALLYQASVVGISRPAGRVTDEVLLVQYRRRMHRKWMFLEVTPQIHFPQTASFHLKTLLFVRLEVYFDESR